MIARDGEQKKQHARLKKKQHVACHRSVDVHVET